ncbi:hypothetical protein CI15_06420 [Paraburkholderia monticola]|uniref:Uncharacterized protein n=1 Tax=Paraburkholderia monticola TaxID=1399968 RepID=A0A149PXV9_9BURK|nr:hypothetical protein [Paraburkholderia monticola]KXU89817.1 hypothetical protein CI15_06420 [Paraburkholderia monticola]
MAHLQSKTHSQSKADKLRVLASQTADAALTAAPERQITVLNAAKQLQDVADGLERRAMKALEQPAVANIPPDATAEELYLSRRRQATRRASEVYLPSWSSMAKALPNTLLRSALFSVARSVQADNDNLLANESTCLVAGKEIATFKNVTLTLSGYSLCQFDRQVYCNCLDYYRDVPLCPEESLRHVRTTFYEFARRMQSEYSVKAHRAIRASVLRLSFAQIRIRYQRMNIEVPKLLSATFEDGEAADDFKGSDGLLLRVTTAVAELFGAGAWTAVDNEAVGYDGLRGWIASFYAGHARPQWLPVESLYRLSGYESNIRNFKASLTRALEKLKDPMTPLCSRVANYICSEDEKQIFVVRCAWVT